METATAVEIDKGRLRQLLLDDFHELFGKAFAKTAPAFPPLPQRRRRPSSLEKAITNKPPNTKFRLLPQREAERSAEGSRASGYSRGRVRRPPQRNGHGDGVGVSDSRCGAR